MSDDLDLLTIKVQRILADYLQLRQRTRRTQCA